MSLSQSLVGEIAAAVPGATAVFRRHKIDFCCGGAVPLAEACSRRGLDTEAVAAELQGLQNQGRDDTAIESQAIPALIEYILARFHDKHRSDLPELIRLASRVEAVHREHPDCPRGLADALRDTHNELEMHMQKEEQILFPMLAAGRGRLMEGPIQVMQQEHDEHGVRLRELERLAHHFELPAEACNTWRATYAGLQALIDDLMQHIHLENNVLFPRAQAGL